MQRLQQMCLLHSQSLFHFDLQKDGTVQRHGNARFCQ